jgi:hypothetical protein
VTRLANLTTRTARLKLKPEARHRAKIGADLFIDYRRPKSGVGSWSLRRYVDGKYPLETFAVADDLDEADDVKVLSYNHACERARELAKAHVERERLKADGPPLTIARVNEEYADGREERWAELGAPRLICAGAVVLANCKRPRHFSAGRIILRVGAIESPVEHAVGRQLQRGAPIRSAASATWPAPLPRRRRPAPSRAGRALSLGSNTRLTRSVGFKPFFENAHQSNHRPQDDDVN